MSDSQKNPETVSDDDLDQAQGGLILNLSVGLKDTSAEAPASASPHRYDPYKSFKFR